MQHSVKAKLLTFNENGGGGGGGFVSYLYLV